MYGNRFLPMFLFGMFVMIAAGVPVAFAAFRLLRLVNWRKLPAVAKWICRIALGGLLAAAVAPALGAGTFLTPSADLRAAAENGDTEAQFLLGWRYRCGSGVKCDREEAVKWLEKAAARGHVEAQALAAVERGDAHWAFVSVVKGAREGRIWSQLLCGIFCEYGIGTEKNFSEAVKWYRSAAERGLPEAQYSLGECCAYGDGVTRKPAEAVKWYRLAAEQGLPEAQYELGDCLFRGDGVKRDPAEAVKWYRLAAEQGNASAQFRFGWCCEYGDGVERDLAEAAKWYRRAAENGHSRAPFRLGKLYENGGAEADVRPVPFRIMRPWRIRRTRSHSIRLIHWGKDTYRYVGEIKFDGIVAEGDFRQPPLVVLKYDGLYYFICALPLSNYVDFQLYDGKTIRRVPCRDVPFEVLTYRFPDDFPKSEEWQNVLSVYVLRELLRTDQQLCEKVLRCYLSDNILKPILCLHFPWSFSSDLCSLAVSDKIVPELKSQFFRDIQNIIGRGLTELHSSEELQRYFFILCCLDYPRAAVFAEKFCSEYDRADKAGTLKLYGYGFAPDDPRFPKGEENIRMIKKDIAGFDDDLKRVREYEKGYPVLYPIRAISDTGR